MFIAPIITPLVFFLANLIAHPHVPKAIVALGAGGKFTVQYFTVPYNPEQLKGLAAGFEWHLGFAAFENEAELRSGDTVVPAGRWKFSVVRGETADSWSILLEPYELWQAERGGARNPAAAEKAKAIQAALAEKKIPERLVLAATKHAGDDAEHLDMSMVLHGYQAAERGSSKPAGGLSFTVRLDFGDLHYTCDLQESFSAGPEDTTSGRGR